MKYHQDRHEQSEIGRAMESNQVQQNTGDERRDEPLVSEDPFLGQVAIQPVGLHETDSKNGVENKGDDQRGRQREDQNRR